MPRVKFESWKDNIDKNEFLNYYKNHNIWDTADYYNTNTHMISKYCKFIGYKKDKFQETIDRVSKEDIIKYYIEEDHEWEETADYFNITRSMFDKIKIYYGIKKDKSKVYKKALDLKYEEYGSKEEYQKHLLEEKEKTLIDKYGSVQNFYDERSKKLIDAWNAKTLEEQKDIIDRTMSHGGGWNHKTALKTLEEKYGVNNSYALANFKSQSRLNKQFEELLLQNDLYESKEFVLKKPEGYYYRYDFKIGDILIEINPWITHNSSWNIFGDSPLDPYYHYNKTKLALDKGYKCICIFDWIDKDEVLKLLKNGFTQFQYNKPKRYLFNIKTNEYKLSEDDIYNNNWVVIYDDGTKINPF